MPDKKKIVVVEDEKTLLEALVRKLSSANFDVLGATDGEAGKELILTERPDLIILDLGLPKKAGLALLQELREHPWGKNAAVMVLTNTAEVETVEAAKNLKVLDYMIKTNWTIDDIVKKIEYLYK